jgi:DNA-binding MarR family transcriptional regulator
MFMISSGDCATTNGVMGLVKSRKFEVGHVGEVNPLMPPLALAFRRVVSVIERESGVAGMQWFVLVTLGRRDGLSQGELIQEYELDPSRVTRNAKSLEADGLVRRERAPEDNRVVRMYLTDKGRELLWSRLPKVNEELRRRVHSVLTDGELRELRRILNSLSEAMKD